MQRSSKPYHRDLLWDVCQASPPDRQMLLASWSEALCVHPVQESPSRPRQKHQRALRNPNVGSLRRVGGWDSKIATFGSRPLESQNGMTSRNDKCIPKPTKLNAFTAYSLSAAPGAAHQTPLPKCASHPSLLRCARSSAHSCKRNSEKCMSVAVCRSN